MNKRSKFSLSNYKLLSANQGWLFPINVTEVLPGDTIQQKTSAMIRVAPLATPVMHPVHARIHHFFVPNRIIWDGWEDFITGGEYGSTPPVFPTIPLPDSGSPLVGISSLIDYMGINPVSTGDDTKYVSALPIRAYQKIYNDWFRDQDIMPEAVINKGSGSDVTTSLQIQNVAWGKDYFTTARPWSQKSADVLIPASTATLATDGSPTIIRNASGGSTFNSQDLGTTGTGQLSNVGLSATAYVDPAGMSANVGAAMGSINDLRLAFGLQSYAEARAIYGSRYVEYLRYLGVNSSDARLQNAEYLGGGTSTIQFSEVLQTAPSEDDPVGTMKGHGIAGMGTNRYRKFFEEHGFIISVISVLPVPVYSTAIERFWLKRTKEDFFQKELQHIGMQEISSAELMFLGTNQTAGTNFGYQLRYDEYRRQLSSVAGEFRGQLADWHMARFFEATPALNADFVRANPTTRVYSAPGEDQLYIMAHNSIQARRIISQSGKPKVL